MVASVLVSEWIGVGSNPTPDIPNLEFGGTSGIYLQCSYGMHKQTNTNHKNRRFRACMTLLINSILGTAYCR